VYERRRRIALAVGRLRLLPARPAGGLAEDGSPGQHRAMTIIKINAITVPADAGDELAHRFAARAGAVDGQEGFEGFELMKPTDDRTTWLVVTRWRDEASFEAWLHSPAFAHGHAQASAAGDMGGHGGAHAHGGHPGGAEGHGGGHPGGHGGPGGPAPIAVSSEVWSYVPVVTERGVV
jgi:heme-degrading monooxygenase HmoA